MKLRIEANEEYIECELRGHYRFYSVRKIFKTILTNAKAHNIKNILLDVRNVKGKISKIDRFMVAEIVSKLYSRDIKLALVVTPEQNNQEDQLFVTAAKNRGIQTIAVNEYSDAIKWLSDG